MKKLFKKFRLYLFIVGPISLITLVLSLIPTNYDLIFPAEVSNLDQVFSFKLDGENYTNSDANIYSVSIYEYYKVNTLTYLLNKLYPYSVVNEHLDIVNTSIEYSMSSGNIQKSVSLTNALVVGYNSSKKDIEYTFKGYIIHSLYGSSNNYFQLGDIIIRTENIDLDEKTTPGSILINDERTLTKDGEYQFTVLRNGEEVELMVKPFIYSEGDKSYITIGIAYYPYYPITDGSANPEFKIDYPDSIGPSAGLMQSLFVFDSLTDLGITDGLKICGTGTINIDGTVGTIGGVESKICCAVKAGMDVFFVPAGNYDDAYERYKSLKTDMELVKVSTLDDVIKYLCIRKGIDYGI